MTLFIIARKLKFPNDETILKLCSQNVFGINRRHQQQKQYSIQNNSTSSINLSKINKENINKNLSRALTNLKTKIFPKNIKVMSQNVIGNFFVYVEEISHMDEVRNAQYRVIQLKDTLKEAGDKKREILNDLTAIRKEIQKNHTEICNAMRGTERYISLVRDEMTLLNNEQTTQKNFSEADENERGLFNEMTIAINDSYEKEKIHSNFIKVLGLICTLTASILTLIASAIGHYYHNTKFGLVANDFKENVNRTIKKEITTLKDVLRLDITTAMNKQEELIKKYSDNKKKTQENDNRESWTSYIKRHTINVMKYITPKSYW